MRDFVNVVFYALLAFAALMLLYNVFKMLAGDPGNTPTKTLLLILLDPINWLLLVVWAIRRHMMAPPGKPASDSLQGPHQ